MKQTIKKILIIFCAVFLAVFTTVAYPAQQAQAGPLVGGVVPGGITLGAGAYTLGAMGLAGIVGLAGYEEYEEEINAHAARAWENGTAIAKTSMNGMISASVGAGNAVTAVGADMLKWLENTYYPDIAANLATLPPFTSNAGVSSRTSYSNDSAGNVIGLHITHSTQNGATITVDGEKYSTFKVSAYYDASDGSKNIGFYSSCCQVFYKKTVSTGAASSAVSLLKSNSNKPTTTQLAAVLTLAGASVSVQGADGLALPEWTAYQEGVSKVREQWESMRDAGLVLPVDSVTSHVGDKVVTRNPNADTYTDDAGTVYAPTDVTHAFPQPRIRTGEAVGVPGVFVDTPALTGNPAIDDSIVGNPAIPKTTTNVNTGTTIANPDIAVNNPSIPVDPPITGVPPVVPPFDAPGTTGLDFTPLMMTGTAMTEKFPFSIPFDFVKQLQVLNVEPEAPSFNIDVPKFLEIGGFTIPFKFKLSFEMFDPIANIIRWGLVIIFDISLIFAIRKLLPE